MHVQFITSSNVDESLSLLLPLPAFLGSWAAGLRYLTTSVDAICLPTSPCIHHPPQVAFSGAAQKAQVVWFATKAPPQIWSRVWSCQLYFKPLDGTALYANAIQCGAVQGSAVWCGAPGKVGIDGQ